MGHRGKKIIRGGKCILCRGEGYAHFLKATANCTGKWQPRDSGATTIHPVLEEGLKNGEKLLYIPTSYMGDVDEDAGRDWWEGAYYVVRKKNRKGGYVPSCKV